MVYWMGIFVISLGKIVAEATYNIRTVASLTKEEMIYNNYEKSLSVPAR